MPSPGRTINSAQSACLNLTGAQRPRVLEARCAAQPDEVLDVQRAAQALAQQHGVLADLGGGGEQQLTEGHDDMPADDSAWQLCRLSHCAGSATAPIPCNRA